MIKPSRLSETARKRLYLTIFFIVSAALLSWMSYTSTPERLIMRTLQTHGVEKSVAAQIELEKTGRGRYKIIDPPVDPETGIPLENWKIDSLGAYYYAVPLDWVEAETRRVQSRGTS